MSDDEQDVGGHPSELAPIKAAATLEEPETLIDWRDTLVNQREFDRQALMAVLTQARQELAACKARWLIVRANGRGMGKDMHPAQLQADAKAWADRIASCERAVAEFDANAGLAMPSGIEVPEPGTVIPIAPDGAA